MKHCHKKSVAHESPFRFGHDGTCYYCLCLSHEALCSPLCLEHLAQIRAALKLVQEDIKRKQVLARWWSESPLQRSCALVRAPPAHHCLTDAKKDKAVTWVPVRVVKIKVSLCGRVYVRPLFLWLTWIVSSLSLRSSLRGHGIDQVVIVILCVCVYLWALLLQPQLNSHTVIYSIVYSIVTISKSIGRVRPFLYRLKTFGFDKRWIWDKRSTFQLLFPGIHIWIWYTTLKIALFVTEHNIFRWAQVLEQIDLK